MAWYRPTGRDDGLEGALEMTDDEYGTKFNNLVSIDYIYLPSNQLSRIPSLKNMGKLKALHLAENKITMIAPGDFAGATQLVSLKLSGNIIVSIAKEAFLALSAFRVLPHEFNPTKKDGTLYTTGPGMPVWTNPALGAFEDPLGHTKFGYSSVAIGLAPNPVECLWVGPRMSDFDCSTCVLGYERDRTATVPTCAFPDSFKPHRGWHGSSNQTLLKLNDTHDNAIEQYLDTEGTNISILLTGHTYVIMKPLLYRHLVDSMALMEVARGCVTSAPFRTGYCQASLPPPFTLTCTLWMVPSHLFRYTVPPPQLEPKERMFAGYVQQY